MNLGDQAGPCEIWRVAGHTDSGQGRTVGFLVKARMKGQQGSSGSTPQLILRPLSLCPSLLSSE